MIRALLHEAASLLALATFLTALGLWSGLLAGAI